jgi:soluble lytic murein transglycosylase
MGLSSVHRKMGYGMSSGLARQLAGAAMLVLAIASTPVWAEFAASTTAPTPVQPPLLPEAAAPQPVVAPTPVAPPAWADPIARDIATWDRLRSDGAPLVFGEFASFLRAHPGWPSEHAMRRRAERAMTAATPLADRLAFFAQFPPLSPIGEFRLAEAYLSNGRGPEALRLARKAWGSDGLTAGLEAELFARFGPQLTALDHWARVDELLWSGQTGAATRLLPLLPSEYRLVADARMALRSDAYDAAQRLAAVPTTLQNDPGLLVERAEWMKRSGDTIGARRMMAAANVRPGMVADRQRWMAARLSLARGAANDGQHDLAYAIAAKHNSFPLGRALTDYSDGERDVFTDLEFVAGRMALRFLGRPAQAVEHFQNYRAASKAPATQARGDYWTGRAAEAAGRRPEAQRFYAAAGTHPDYFYGQLALERMGRPVVLPAMPQPNPAPMLRQAFANDELVRAARYLGRVGDRTRQTLFLRALVEKAETLDELKLVADLGRDLGRIDMGVHAGRAARGVGELALIDAAFPKLPIPVDSRWTMTHAITRQESRFDRAAVSSANAQGLMQLMPATAREQAGKMGLPYDFARLTRDEEYNVTLGAAYYERLVSRWGGNHMLAVASYNAGAGNVSKWVNSNGDPRGGVDTVEWIESIPFSETRNYVMRVLENAVVYDLLHPARGQTASAAPLSAYLGKRQPG